MISTPIYGGVFFPVRTYVDSESINFPDAARCGTFSETHLQRIVSGAVRTVMAQLTRREAYLRMLHGISIELSPSNVRSIVFLTDLASQELPQSGEGHRSGLEVLQLLWRRGHFSETRLQPLEGLLKEIVRNDLLGKHLEEFKEKYPGM